MVMPGIEKSDILFIINPHSGNKNPSRILKLLKNEEPLISYIVTNNKKEVEEIFSGDFSKYKAVVVVGGDGTVNEVLKYLYDRPNIALAVLPTGSGNGFAKELHFKNNLKLLLNSIYIGKTLDIDLLDVNNNICINVAGLGFDSFVAHRFQEKGKRGFRSYISTVIKSVFQFSPFDVKITTSKLEITGRYQMITIANTRQFGNNAFISPASKPDDGVFEIVLVKPFPFYYYPIFIIRMFLGNLKNSKYVKYICEKDSVSIISNYKKYHIDGDPYLFNDALNIKMLINKIKIIKIE